MSNNFKNWFRENLGEYRRDIARYGCDAGFPHITYTSDCVDLYNQFEDEIYTALREDAESFGYDSVDSFTSSFRRKDMLDDPDTRKNLLLWYMVEREASHEY